MVSERRRSVSVERGALAAYLDDLEWDTLHLPGGWPAQTPRSKPADAAPTPSARSTRRAALGRPPSPSQSAARSGRGDAASGTATSEAYRVEIPGDLSDDRRSELYQVAREHASDCRACTLCEKRNKVVFGHGDTRASLMLIGEGPGAAEDREGLPFVGPAGELLTKMLAAIEIDRDSTYIANVVKCRPPGNRDPKPEEVAACSGYLEAQVRLIRPQVILALGRVAAQSLLVTTESLGKLRGRWHEYAGVPVWVTYHPAALLRNTSYKRPTWEDLQLVRDRLAELEAGADA